MFKNYLKSAWRFLWQNKVFTLINALGLSVALAASFIILLYVINEWSYDHCHKNRKQVYRVLTQIVDMSVTQTGTPYILSRTLKEEFPQVEKAVTARTMTGFKLKIGEEMIPVPYVVGTTSEVFDIFTIPMLSGMPGNHLLADENSLVLCRELAEKFFPGQDLVGKEVTALVNNKEHTFSITGVFDDIPVNSTFRAKCMVNSKWTIDPINKAFKIDNAETSWNHNLWLTWVLLAPDAGVKDLENQIKNLENKYLGEKPLFRYQFQNLSDVYLKSANIANSFIAGNLKNVRLFSAIAFLIILVAAGNYIILSTAVSTRRAKEIGIRKTNGALGSDLKMQMLGESVLLAILILPFALVMMWFSLPHAGKLFQTKLILMGSNMLLYVLVFIALTILIGVISGLYTSAYLSRLKVVDILKNSTPGGSRRAIFRSLLIAIQLIIFSGFVASTLIVRSQYLYALKKNPGYYTSDVLLIEMGQDIGGYRAYLQAIKSNPNVISAAGTMDGLPMMGTMTSMISHYSEKEKRVKVEGLAVDSHFLETMGVSFVRGRDFSVEFGTDLKEAVIFNETAVKLIGLPDSAELKYGSRNVIGVVKDFNLHSIRTDIPPLMITMTDRYINQLAVRHKPGTRAVLIPALETEWKKVAGDRPFKYDTIENINLELYKSEKNLSLIITLSAFFTLFIAALGLLGITLFTARTRTKEIGIRKAFGSSEKIIVLSFLKWNFILVVAACALSVPLTMYIMNRWLTTFSYHIKIEWWVFAVSFVMALLLVLLTVIFHAVRASRTNPVEALRYE